MSQADHFLLRSGVKVKLAKSVRTGSLEANLCSNSGFTTTICLTMVKTFVPNIHLFLIPTSLAYLLCRAKERQILISSGSLAAKGNHVT